MSIKTRAVPVGWVPIIELIVSSDGSWTEFDLPHGIRFSNGETILGVRARKKYYRPMRHGVFKLYRSKIGHPKFRASRGVSYEVNYAEPNQRLEYYKCP